ncbi:MAG: RES domain-containing protein [Myxococcales bacterium]|nr:RES domain-containing protein [Myxococcales bacterium]
MGISKRQHEEATAYGFNLFAAEGYAVCVHCFNDGPLRKLVRDAACVDECSFCGRTASSPIAAPLRPVVQFIGECLLQHYGDANDWLPYESAEGGYFGSTYDVYELLDHVGLCDELADDAGGLNERIGDALGDGTWCEIDPFGMREHEHLLFSWERFCDTIKHGRRFFFMAGDSAEEADLEPDQLLSPAEVLNGIVERSLPLRLVRTLTAGGPLYRARFQPPGSRYRGALELGAPPPSMATQSNRMSPPGVVMTYLSLDEQTALEETMAPTIARPQGAGAEAYAVASFELLQDVNVLDLTRIPSVPTIFERERARELAAIRFLSEFERHVSLKIARDDRVHVDYVPTQVVTEYFRVAPQLVAQDVRGVVYRSARPTGGRNVVLFGGRELLDLSRVEARALEAAERAVWPQRSPLLRLVDARECLR